METPSNPDPLVSICIPVFNAEKTIRKTIASLINQTYKNIEIIVVDNCSTDSTLNIVREFDDPRLRIIENDTHFPYGEYNWNRCFQYVKGEYMAIFHADDVYDPMMVACQIDAFSQFPSISCVFTNGYIIDKNDEIVGKLKLPLGIPLSKPFGYQELLVKTLEYLNFLPCPSAMIRTTLYLSLAPFRYDQFGYCSDLDMWLRAAEIAPIMILNEKLLYNRISKGWKLNLLRTHEADFFKVLDFHLAKSKKHFEISRATIDKYELLRLADALIRARNFLWKNDVRGFKSLLKNFSWIKHIQIAMRYLLFSASKWDYIESIHFFIAYLFFLLGREKYRL